MSHDQSSAGSEPVAWEFRQRSGVGKGPQSQAPWGEWCSITREAYDMYISAPNKLVEVRALYRAVPQTSAMRAALESAQRIIDRDFPNGQLAIDIRNALR